MRAWTGSPILGLSPVVAAGRCTISGLAGVGEGDVVDQDGVAGCRRQHAVVGRLAARGGVEDGAVEEDATCFGEPEDGGAALLEIGVFTEQAVGWHDGHKVWRIIMLE